MSKTLGEVLQHCLENTRHLGWLQSEIATAQDTLDQQRPCGCAGLREAAQVLVDRLKAIHNDPLYQSIWFSAHNHGIDYSNGPKYDKELESLTNALKAQLCQQPKGFDVTITNKPDPGTGNLRPVVQPQASAETKSGENK